MIIKRTKIEEKRGDGVIRGFFKGKIKKKLGKKGFEVSSVVVKWIFALLTLVVLLIIISLLKKKGFGIIDLLSNIIRTK